MQVRPLIDLELTRKAKDCVQLVPPNKIKLASTGSSDGGEGFNFDYDRVYKLNSKEESRRLFAELVQPLLDRFLQGFNVTVSLSFAPKLAHLVSVYWAPIYTTPNARLEQSAAELQHALVCFPTPRA